MSEEQRALVRDLAMELVRYELASETLATINAIGRQLAVMTAQDREQAETGELGVEWQSRALSQEEARQMLCEMTLNQIKAFCDRWGHYSARVMDWADGWTAVPDEVLAQLGGHEENCNE